MQKKVTKNSAIKNPGKYFTSSLVIGATLFLSACGNIGATGTSPQPATPTAFSSPSVEVLESPSAHSLELLRPGSPVELVATSLSGKISVTEQAPQEDTVVEEAVPVEETVETPTETGPELTPVAESLPAPKVPSPESPVGTIEETVEQTPITPQAPPAVNTSLYPASTVTFSGVTVPISYDPLLTEVQAGVGTDADRLSAPAYGAGIFAGNNNSVRDNTGLFLVGHSPGSFAPMMNLGVGSRVTLSDANGESRTFEVREFYRLNVNGVSLEDGVTDYYSHVTDVSGEKLILQACEDIAATRLRVLIAFPID